MMDTEKFEDITERKQAEELRRRAALDKMRVSVYEMREDTDIQRVLASLYEALKDIGVDFEECSVQIIDGEKGNFGISWQKQDECYYLGPDRTLPMIKTSATDSAVYQAWRDKRPIYRPHLDFAEYIRHLANYLFRSYQVDPDTIQLKINVGDVSISIDKAIPCGLILNELVSNSLKHAFPEGKEGEIRIDLHSEEDKYTLIISDNGVGFPRNVDFRNTESLGLQLVVDLTEQLDGTIELDGSGGTTFKITFPQAKGTK